nr:actin-binding protein WASF1 [Oryctolagus cuniculus]
MSLNEEKDKGCPKQLAIPPKIQDEIVQVIQTSLSNIAIQINNLDKYAEDLLRGISKEVDWFFYRIQVLQERIIYLTDGITYKNQNPRLFLPARKSKKTSQSTAIQKQQVHSSEPLLVKMYETHDACVQTLPLHIPTAYCQDDTEGLQISPGTSCFFQLCKEKNICKSRELKGRKLEQTAKHLDHFNEPKSVLQSQRMQHNASVEHTQAICGAITNSYANQPVQRSSLSNYQVNEISKLLTRTVGKMLSKPLQKTMDGSKDLKQSCANYGTEMGEELQPQPRIQLKTDVFVSPMAPTSPPPLPPDWLAVLRASKMASPHPIIHYPTQLPSPILKTPPTTAHPDCLQTTSEAPLPITPPKLVVSPPVTELFQHYKLIANDLLPKREEKVMSPPISPCPVFSHRSETKNTVTDQASRASVGQPPASSVCPSVRSASTKSPRPLVAESARSTLTPPSRYLISATRSSITPLSRLSTPQKSKISVPLSFSRPQPSRSSVPVPRRSLSQPPRSSAPLLSRCADAQSRKSPVAQSGRPSAAQPAMHLISPQSTSSNLTSPTLQPLFSFVQSPSTCVPCSQASNPQALSVSQSYNAPLSPDFKLSPSTPPIYNKARSVLMEAIRKGVLLREIEDPCVLKAKIEIAKNEPPSIQIQRKPAGCTSAKLGE